MSLRHGGFSCCQTSQLCLEDFSQPRGLRILKTRDLRPPAAEALLPNGGAMQPTVGVNQELATNYSTQDQRRPSPHVSWTEKTTTFN